MFNVPSVKWDLISSIMPREYKKYAIINNSDSQRYLKNIIMLFTNVWDFGTWHTPFSIIYHGLQSSLLPAKFGRTDRVAF